MWNAYLCAYLWTLKELGQTLNWLHLGGWRLATTYFEQESAVDPEVLQSRRPLDTAKLWFVKALSLRPLCHLFLPLCLIRGLVTLSICDNLCHLTALSYFDQYVFKNPISVPFYYKHFYSFSPGCTWNPYSMWGVFSLCLCRSFLDTLCQFNFQF